MKKIIKKTVIGLALLSSILQFTIYGYSLLESEIDGHYNTYSFEGKNLNLVEKYAVATIIHEDEGDNHSSMSESDEEDYVRSHPNPGSSIPLWLSIILWLQIIPWGLLLIYAFEKESFNASVVLLIWNIILTVGIFMASDGNPFNLGAYY